MDFETKLGYEIGKKDRETYFNRPCPKCGVFRWVRKRDGDRLCMSCCQIGKKRTSEQIAYRQKIFTGSGNPAWKGGRVHGGHKQEYMMVWVSPDDFFYPMAIRHGKRNKGYILEHRLIMAKQLNRCLLPWEVVHHKNGIKDDNRLENLELVFDKHHLVDQKTKSYIKSLQDEIAKLKAKP